MSEDSPDQRDDLLRRIRETNEAPFWSKEFLSEHHQKREQTRVLKFPRKLEEPLKPFYASHILETPPAPEFIWDGLLLRGTLVVLAGAGKIGKSLLLQQLLASASIGQPVLGRETTRIKSFGWFCEDPQDWLVRRQLWIAESLGVEVADFELQFSWDSRLTKNCILAGFSFNGEMSLTKEWKLLWEYVADEGVQLVGIDTAATVFDGNENNRGQVTQFQRALSKKAIEINGCIILNAHPPKSDPKGLSGSNAWLNSSRGALSLQRPPEYDEMLDEPRDTRWLCGLGTNYGARGAPIALRWYQNTFQPSDPIPTASPSSALEKVELEYRLLAGLHRAIINGAKIPADEWASGSLPSRARKAADLCKVSFNALADAQHRLMEGEKIVRVSVNGRCLIRPASGPSYDSEEQWSK